MDQAREGAALLRSALRKQHPDALLRDWSRQQIETTGFALTLEDGTEIGVRRSMEFLAVMNSPDADTMKRILFQLKLGETPMHLQPVDFRNLAPIRIEAATE